MTKTVMMALALSLGLARVAAAADPEHGKQVFSIWCAGCHEPLPGRGYSPPAGSYVLEQRYHGTLPSALEQRTDLTAAYIKTMVRNGRNMMPQTRQTEVSNADLDDLVAYLTHSK